MRYQPSLSSSLVVEDYCTVKSSDARENDIETTNVAAIRQHTSFSVDAGVVEELSQIVELL